MSERKLVLGTFFPDQMGYLSTISPFDPAARLGNFSARPAHLY